MFVMFFELLSRARDYPFAAPDSIQATAMCRSSISPPGAEKMTMMSTGCRREIEFYDGIIGSLQSGWARVTDDVSDLLLRTLFAAVPWMENASSPLKNQQKKITRRTISFTRPARQPAKARSLRFGFYCETEERMENGKKWFIQISAFATRFHQTETPTTASCVHDSSSLDGLLSAPG